MFFLNTNYHHQLSLTNYILILIDDPFSFYLINLINLFNIYFKIPNLEFFYFTFKKQVAQQMATPYIYRTYNNYEVSTHFKQSNHVISYIDKDDFF